MSTPVPSYVDLPSRLRKVEDVFKTFGWQLLCGMRVSCPAIIQSFDATEQTVTVQLAIRENMLRDLIPTPTDLPILKGVPIVLPRAGGYTLALPIAAGDECLVVFGDMCIDSWWESGGVQNQFYRRRHDLSDGFAILGCWNKQRVLPDYPVSTAQLRSDDGQTMVEVDGDTGTINITGPNQVNIHSAASVDINGSGNTTIEGRNFLLHTHTGVQTGGGTSGPVL